MINHKLALGMGRLGDGGPMDKLMKAWANSKIRPSASTLKAAQKLPNSYPQKKAALRGVISRDEIADLLRNARSEKDFSANLKLQLRELAARSERVVEFAGGYVNTSQGVLNESGAGGHFNRNAGAYYGTLLFPGVGTAIGALIDLNRRKKNRIYTEEENPISDRTAASLARGFSK
jgi:hypothetical protein